MPHQGLITLLVLPHVVDNLGLLRHGPEVRRQRLVPVLGRRLPPLPDVVGGVALEAGGDAIRLTRNDPLLQGTTGI